MNLEKPLLLLTDYRGAFLSTAQSKSDHLTMNVPSIVSEFTKRNIEIEVRRFGDLDFSEDFKGRHVIYTSSEDSNLRYKSFIEDALLTLSILGAVILPRYELLRSHHNKTMMEGLRYALFSDEAIALETKIFGAFEDIRSDWAAKQVFPKVIKAASGAGSVSVARASDPVELMSKLQRLSRSAVSYSEKLRELGKRRLHKGWQPRSLHRDKFVIQNMIKGLSGDFKVLVFGDRYYILSRKNRPNDFRASGSGLFSFDIPDGVDVNNLLDFAKFCYDRIDAPTLSIDVAFDGAKFWMIEFQAVHFGTLTAEKSHHYFTLESGQWAAVAEKCVVEAAYAHAITTYLSRSQAKNNG